MNSVGRYLYQRHRRSWLTLGFVLFVSTAATAEVDFAHDVLPILRNRCAKCHTNGQYKAGFSMDTREALLDSGNVEVGNAAESELVDRVQTTDVDLRMPPEGEALTVAEIDVLQRWIKEGIAWERAFSFKTKTWSAPLAPRKPALPPGDGHPIDRLMAAYFAAHNLEPLPATGDQAFARRATLDLIGLLPDPTELTSFANNSASDKRAALIDELLNRHHDYAVHWMTFWNDLLRNDYAGTGYIDGGRQQITTWLYRSLYINKPYDLFVGQLVAPNEETVGFANGIQWRGNVNASQVPELQYSQNVAQVFLGENLKCASCHDSFINDWKLTDAYGLAAVVAEKPLELHRCDKSTGQYAQPKFLWPELGTIDPAHSKAERMQALARLMTSPENGRLARTIVNRLWQRLMGRGLVEPVDVMGNRPWNEDLLDFLAIDLADHGYDLKRTMRLIATSAVYQAECQSASDPPAANFLFRGPLARRMSAEQFVDAVCTLTGEWPEKPDAKIETLVTSNVRAPLVQSSLLMRTLGRPNREQVVSTRDDRLSTLQALELSNGAAMPRMLRAGADRLLIQFDTTEDLLNHLFCSALAREPAGKELELLAEMVENDRSAQTVTDVLWMIIMLPEFQHIR